MQHASMHAKQGCFRRRDRSRAGFFAAIGCALLGSLTTTCTPSAAVDVAHKHRQSGEVDRLAQPRSPAGNPSIDHIVIITIDGVRWREVFLGVDPKLGAPRATQSVSLPNELMPALHRIAQTSGILLGGDDSKMYVSSPSTVSLPGYSELFSGRTPSCGNNDCGPTKESTLLDDWHQSDSSASMALVSSWERIPRVAARDRAHLLISAGRTRPQNLDSFPSDTRLQDAIARGKKANPAPGVDDYRPDRFTAEIGLRLLDHRRPQFLFLGLGDTDEHAHHGDYGSYLQALRDADAVVGHVDAWLSSQRELGKRTLLVVTADHGRAATFQDHGGAREAARIWMLWSGDAVNGRGYPPAPDSRLADTAQTLRTLLGLAPDEDPRAGRELAVLVGPVKSSGPVGIGLVAAAR